MKPIARCKGCGFEDDVKKFDDCVSVYHDVRCPRCGTTAIDTSQVNAFYRAEGSAYGWGDDNMLDRTSVSRRGGDGDDQA
jgi:hypothetical protein